MRIVWGAYWSQFLPPTSRESRQATGLPVKSLIEVACLLQEVGGSWQESLIRLIVEAGIFFGENFLWEVRDWAR